MHKRVEQLAVAENDYHPFAVMMKELLARYDEEQVLAVLAQYAAE